MPRTVSRVSYPKTELTLPLLCNCAAAFKRPRFKRVGMKRAKKSKIVVAEAESMMQQRIAVAGGGQAADPAALQQHSGVAAAPAPADKLQDELEARQMHVYRQWTLDDLCKKEILKVEKQHYLNLKMYDARLERWAREERSKKPPCASLQIKRLDKNNAFKHESEQRVSAVRYVAMEARAELAEAVCHAHLARIAILKRRVRQLSKCQKSQSCARKARAEK